MIESFREKRTAAVFLGRVPKGFPTDILAAARRKLRILDAAVRLDDLRQPPGNRLEALSGDRPGQHSIRINDQWRVCFVWQDGRPHEVEIWIIMDEPEPMTRSLILRKDLADLDLSDVEAGGSLPPVSPGEVLREEFMAPLGLSARALARDVGVPPNRITAILHGTRAITAETALLLSRRFGTSAEFWMNLQIAQDLEIARRAQGMAA